MPVPVSPSRRHLFGVLGLIIASSCIAEAQPFFQEVPPYAPPSQAAIGTNASPGGEWTVVPPMRYSNFDSDHFDTAGAPKPLQAPLARLQAPPAPPAAAWIAATQTPAPVPANAPLRSEPSPQSAASINTTPAHVTPVSMAPVDTAPASSTARNASSAIVSNVGPVSAPPPQAAWNIAPPAKLTVMPAAPAPSPSQASAQPSKPSAESHSGIATEMRVPSPESGTLIQRP